jgi:DNA-binding protein H-NS
MDLNSCSDDELCEITAECTRIVAARKMRKQDEARSAIKKIAADAGIDLSALAGVEKHIRKQGKSVAIKYINPENSGQTWTGRGRSPHWVTAMRDAGTLDSARCAA